ncbi:camp-dependent protein kinase catalytic subunit [Boothiomyces sp. JEL0866]|nr:camp-dependent protein kinase catalytic subunit [Boothiomyces sp. JEL0866]
MASIRKPRELVENSPERQSPSLSLADRKAPRKVNPIDSAIAGVSKLSIQDPPKSKISLKDFNIEKTLGTGSFGRVHLVKYKENNKYYAMKVGRVNVDVVKMRQVEHTINEKKILEKLTAPFLVHMLTSFQDSANVYFVLEYVQGGELFTFLRKSSRFPNHVAKFYAAEVTLAFENLHSMNIIYRDLKPENILINAQGHIKITDFGFAKQVTEQTWTLCGTPDYLAPEIIQSKGYGSAVDWWALGILIYEMVAGYPPFFHEDPMKLYENILACKPKFSTSFDPTCKDLVKRLLVVDLTKRFGNLKGGADDIKRHKWFLGVDWEKLNALQVAAPYIPPIKGENDTSQFDTYPEEYEPYGQTGKDPYLEYFKEF